MQLPHSAVWQYSNILVDIYRDKLDYYFSFHIIFIVCTYNNSSRVCIPPVVEVGTKNSTSDTMFDFDHI